MTGLAHLHLLRGSIGRPFTGVLPLDHPPGAVGAWDMGLSQSVGEGPIQFLYAAQAHPAPAWTSGAAVRVYQATHMSPEMLAEPGDRVVLLPDQTRHEQAGGGTSTSAERRVRFSPEIPGHPRIGETRPAWAIPAAVFAAAHPDRAAAVTFADAAGVRHEIAREIPRYAGLENMRSAGDWIQWGGPQLYADGAFPAFPDGKARFVLPAEAEVDDVRIG